MRLLRARRRELSLRGRMKWFSGGWREACRRFRLPKHAKKKSEPSADRTKPLIYGLGKRSGGKILLRLV